MTKQLKKWICVFCGSAVGARAEYSAAAGELGRAIAERGYGMVFGGGSVGLMGVAADAVLEAGGEVVGVIPDVIVDREIGHDGVTELRVVRTMHERKAAMADRADAFIALPGGFGTMDEFMEIVTWAQLGIHSKPCVLVNVAGYYDALLRFMDGAVEEGFIRAENRALVRVARDAAEALEIVECEWGVREEVPPHDERLDLLVE
ncbi:MAG: TIGR00730 family Rossman fold protein [Acidobacteriaceae bacterium]